MPTLIHHHDYPIAPEQLDAYLSTGWRPAGQAVYTADFLRTDNDELYGTIQVRLPLKGFAFKKRHRKLLKQNGQRFTHTCEVAYAPDEELLALNRRYMQEHPAKSREELTLHVTGEYGWQALDTRIIRIYDGDKLIAFSYFDLGARTAYTKAGIYDPEYRRFSLGIYSMALEIAWLRKRGIAYYHPGYVVPRYPMFDYKLQFGQMEFRQLSTGNWLPFDPAQPEDNYLMVQNALTYLQQAITRSGQPNELFEYASFTARFHYETDGMSLLDAVFFLFLGRADLFGSFYIATYQLETQAYQLLRVKDSHLRDVRIPPKANGLRRYAVPLLVVDELLSSDDVSEVVIATQQLVIF